MIQFNRVLPPSVASAIRDEALRAARRLWRYGFARDDVHQELVLHWLRRRSRHDARRSAPQTFAAHVCRRRAISMLESAIAIKRGAAMVCSASQLPVVDQHGRKIERPENISVDMYESRFGLRSQPSTERAILQIDVDRAIHHLPAELAQLARSLATGDSLVEVARSLGISRATANRRLVRLRSAFVNAGLGCYVGP